MGLRTVIDAEGGNVISHLYRVPCLSEVTCPVCMNDEKDLRDVAVPRCGHPLCLECLLGCIAITTQGDAFCCPICRIKISSLDTEFVVTVPRRAPSIGMNIPDRKLETLWTTWLASLELVSSCSFSVSNDVMV